MGKRHDKVGIQRELHLEWFERAANVFAAGYKKREARQEFYEYLNNAPGFDVPPTDQTKTYIAHALIKSWIDPDKDLVGLRDFAGELLNSNPMCRSAIHWALISAAYPFWFYVASCTGRLLNLQDQVSQAQIVLRLKEIYGDRQTVSRRARYVIRSFVAWGVLQDADVKGCYRKVQPVHVDDPRLATLLVEAALHANPSGKSAVGLVLNSPAFFPYVLPTISGEWIAQENERIQVDRYGLDDELLKIRS